MAGIKHIHILLDTNKLSRDEIVARQLAHNSISGLDDKEMLKRLFNEIKDVDLKLESFINPADIQIEPEPSIPLLDITPGIEFYHVSLAFLPNQFEKFNDILERLDGTEKGVYALNKKTFNDFKKAVQSTKQIENIKSVGMAVSKMCDIVNSHYKKKPLQE